MVKRKGKRSIKKYTNIKLTTKIIIGKSTSVFLLYIFLSYIFRIYIIVIHTFIIRNGIILYIELLNISISGDNLSSEGYVGISSNHIAVLPYIKNFILILNIIRIIPVKQLYFILSFFIFIFSLNFYWCS